MVLFRKLAGISRLNPFILDRHIAQGDQHDAIHISLNPRACRYLAEMAFVQNAGLRRLITHFQSLLSRVVAHTGNKVSVDHSAGSINNWI
jgi:hypothetical protein